MKRKTIIELMNAKNPKDIQIGKNGLELTHDLKSVFHLGYIEKHKRTPKQGTNPLYDEYTQLLKSDTEWLIWEKPGISQGDLLTAESQILGRVFARAILTLNYDYRWFADIKTLKSRNYRNWKFEDRGLASDMPDWIIAGNNKIASAEAKGTHDSINPESNLFETWSKQSQNIKIIREGIQYNCKSWLIASRWVNEGHRYLPKIFIEDPDSIDFKEPSNEDLTELEKYISKIHTIRNLTRINEIELSEELDNENNLSKRNISRIVWKIKGNKYKKFRFLGNIISKQDGLSRHQFFPFWNFSEKTKHELYFKYINELQMKFMKNSYFDGLEINIIKSHLYGENLPNYENFILGEGYSGSMLSDGSIQISLNDIEIDEEINF